MTKLILKAVSSPKSAASAAVDQVVGQVDTASGAQRLSISAQANTQYRLVDSKTGQVIKNQTVLRKGKTLQIEVEGKNLVELDNFFPTEASDAAPQAPSATYLVDTSATAEPSYGAVSAQSPAGDMVGESSVMWTPGMPALPLSEPVAFGAQVLSALSGISTAGGVALATSVAVVAGSNLDGTDAAGGTQSAGPKVNGSVVAGPVVGQGLVAGLKVQAFDDKGNSLGTADVKADGSYALELSSPNYKGVLVLKVYDDPNDSLTPKYMDEATGKEKSFDTPLLAVVNYSGDATTAQTVNVTPLSHLAALVAGVGTSSNNTVTVPSNLDKNVVQTANIQVAQKFGLVVDDLTSAEVITSDKNTVNDYGRALALWSQMELSNDKTTSDIADTLKSSITTGNNSDLSTLLQKVDDDNTIAIKNISEDDLTYVSDNLTDTTKPEPPASPNDAVTSSDGSKIFLYFGSLLSKNTAEVSAFKVLLTTLGTNGNADTTSDAVISNVAINGGAVVLTLSPNTRVQEGQKISVSYTDPTTDNDLFAVQDATGNDADSFTAQNVVNKVSANPPVIKVEPGQVFTYTENQTDKDLSLTVALEEGSHNTFRFADTQTQTSKDGLYAIDAEGKLFLTSAGLAAGNYSNDFETKFNGGNTMTYMVQAGDVSGYWSDPVEITLKVADAADPPTLSTPRQFTVTEDLSSHLLFDSITFADDDIASLTVTLEVTDGVISGQAATGITVGGTNTARTFTGSVSDLNTYFKTVGNITYTSAANSNGVREISVTVSDGTNSTNSTTSTSTLRIQAVNDAPVASGSATLAAVAEDTTSPAGATVLSLFSGNFNDSKDAVTNGSSANTLAGVAITANTADAVTQGKWQWQADGSSTWNDIATTGLADATALYLAANSLIRFVPVADYKGSPGGLTARLVESSGNGLTNGNVVDVSANGGSTAFSSGTVSLNTSITSVNDAPTLTMAPSSYTVNEDAVVDLTFTGTPFADIDTNSLTVTLSVADGIINATTGGNVTVAGTGTDRTFSGTAADLNAFFTTAGNITYQGAAHVNGSRTLTVTVNDGQNANNTATATSTINITAVNDAPVAASGSATLAAVAEDTTNPAGATVLSLFSGNFNDSKDAVTNGSSANTLAGVAITANAATATQGKWQWQADGSSTWNDIATNGLADATALYLAANSLIRFVPVADYKGTPGGLTARLVESSGNGLNNGNVVDVSANGGSTAFSANSVSLGTSVVDINDAPVVNIPQSFTMNEDTPQLDLVFTGTPFADNENARLTVTLSVTDGSISATDGSGVTVGGTATARTFTGTADELNAFFDAGGNITYQAAAHFNGSRILTVTVDDGSNANNIATVTSTINITAVNDKPQVIAGRGTVSLAPVTEDATNPAGATVGNLFGPSFTDGLDAVPNGSSANVFAGIGITQVASTASQGTWQYSANGTTGWTDIPVTGPDVPSATNVYYFQASTYLRFKPAADFNGTPGAITAYLIEENNSSLTRFTTVNHDYFSATPVTLTTSVTAANDAPTVVQGKEIVSLAAVTEDATNPAGETVTNLLGASFSDAADQVNGGSSSNALKGIAITANAATAAQGKWEYQLSGGAWTAVPTSGLSDSSALFLAASSKLRFVPTANFNGQPGGLQIHLIDDSASGLGDYLYPANFNFGLEGVSGSTATVTLNTSITAVNDAPTVSAPTSFTVNEDVAGNLQFTGTPFADIDTNSLTVTLSVADGSINAINGGNVTVAGTGTARTFSGTAADLNAFFTTAGKITYQGAAHVNGSRTLTVTVNDGQSANNTATATSTINITAVNDAPVASGNASLAAVNEDTTSPAGALVSALFSSRFSDVDGNTLAGVAITANAADAVTQGKWQWQANGSSTWNDIATTASLSGAIYVRADAKIRFLPAANFNGSPPALTVKLVDNSPATIGTVNSGITTDTSDLANTQFSTSTITLGTSITAVNDAPVRTAGTTTPIVVNEDSANSTAVSLGLSSLNYGPGGGGDESSQTLTYKITNIPSSITLWKVDGTTQVNNNTTLTLAELQGLMYKTVANANNSTLANLSWTVTDNGTSPQTITETLGITITAVNDAPVASGSATLTSVAEDTTNPAGALVSALFSSRFSDVDGNTLAGVAITANAATAAQGKWQWQANGGNTWNDIATTGLADATALYLAANTLLRFVPVANYSGTPGALTARLVDSSATGLTNGNSTNVSANGGSTAFSSGTVSLNTSITAVNDAPVASGSATLTSVAEDTTNPAGALVSALFSSRFSDVDGNTLAGVAITANAATAAQGKWQWQANGGNTWNDIATTGLADATALYLAANTLLRFVPVANFNGTPGALTARLVDSSATGLTNGNSSTNVSTNGGTSAYSSTTVSLGTSITAVNDAPTLTATPAILTFTEGVGSTQTAPVNVFNSTTINTVESGQNIISLTLTASGLRDGIKDVVVIDGTVIPITTAGNGTTATNGMSYSVSIPGSVATITLTKSQGITVAQAQTLVNSITYQNTVVDNPLAGIRVFTLTQIKDSGGTANGGVDNTTLNIVANINVVAVNDTPTISAPTSFTVNEDVAGNLQFTGTPFADVDNSTLTVTLSVVDGTINGLVATGITVGGTAIARTFSGTVAALNTYFTTAGNITYQGAANVNGSRTLTVTVNDGQSANNTATTTSTINITAVNDAPVASGSATLAAVAEDTTSPAGALISALFSSRFNDTADAVTNGSSANTLAGVVITANAATAAQGKWQWQANGTTLWTDIAITGLTNTAALYLAANTSLRFVPVANFNGTPGALTARLVDSSATGLTNGTSANVSTNGGSTAFSSGTVSLNTSITAVNDAPTGTVTVSGSVSVGSLLTANNSLADIDGLGTISYKWEVLNGSTWTSVGTATTYTPVAAVVGKFLRLTASYTDGGRTAESVSSSAFTIAPIDTQPPMVKAVNISNSALSLTFNEALIGSTGVPAASAFTLNKYNSANTATNIAITSVEHPINAQTNTPINDQFKLNYANQTLLDSANPYIKLSYADPTTANDTNALQDSTGNDMPSFNLFVYNLNANTATGTNAVDYIMGGEGNDTITGGLGNDVLWGLDTFTANAVTDSDTFVWALGDAGTGAVDIVKDFVALNSTAGDKLNITSLLAGGYNTSTSVLSQWVTVTTGQTLPGSATANSTKIVIDVDGSGTGNVTQTIWLEGVTLSTTDTAVLKNSGVLIA